MRMLLVKGFVDISILSTPVCVPTQSRRLDGVEATGSGYTAMIVFNDRSASPDGVSWVSVPWKDESRPRSEAPIHILPVPSRAMDMIVCFVYEWRSI